MSPINIIVIPSTGPIERLYIDVDLGVLQELVGGQIEAVRIPHFIAGSDAATAYVNEDGKFLDTCRPNHRATDFMVPGAGLFPGDYVAGPFVICGFDPRTGEHTEEIPDPIRARVKLIEEEAG